MAERWDCVVVGSGFGGSVAALRLSEKGYRVLVVEMGKRWRPADNLYFYHDDHLGTPQAMTDVTGTTIWQAQYYPFGAIYQLPVALVENNLRFPGQYWDAETGMAQNYFRDYDESMGRYREADPILASRISHRGKSLTLVTVFGTTNLFRYSSGNPMSLLDPVGLQDHGGRSGLTFGDPEIDEDTLEDVAQAHGCVAKCISNFRNNFDPGRDMVDWIEVAGVLKGASGPIQITREPHAIYLPALEKAPAGGTLPNGPVAALIHCLDGTCRCSEHMENTRWSVLDLAHGIYDMVRMGY